MTQARIGIVAATVSAGVFLTVFLTARRAPPPPPPTLKAVVEPARPMVQIYPGHIEAQHTAFVDIAKPGTIEAFFVDAGQDVAEGQLLARLVSGAADPGANTAARRKVEALTAAIAESKLEAARAQADVRHAKDESARAQKVFELQRKLSDAGATPRRTFEQARDEFTASQNSSAKFEEASRQADNRTYALTDQLRDATAALEIADKQAETARAALNAAEIHAPTSGIVVARKAQIGQKTGPAEGKEAFQIAVDLSLLRAVFEAGPETAARIHPGSQVLLTIPELPSAPIPASVTAIDGTHAQADFTSPAPAIRPGMLCSVSVQLK